MKKKEILSIRKTYFKFIQSILKISIRKLKLKCDLFHNKNKLKKIKKITLLKNKLFTRNIK